MAEIQQQIAKLFPEAAFEQGDKLQITIPDAQWHKMALTLRDVLKMDYLVTIVGMDWQTSMGAIYYLMSTATNEEVAVRVQTTDREKPMLHSVSDVWTIAEIYEREVYDFFGIIFIGNQDMRRLFLNIDWKGFPLRKDYDADPEINPVSIENERQTDFTDVYTEGADGKVVKGQRRIFQEDDFVVNIGPQHPATHGVLRFRTAIDGETIKKIDIYLGYIHRGVEKLCENLTYPQTLHFMDRLDYFSAHNYHHGLCMTIEKAAGIEISRRAQVIRVMMDELSRIASHCLFIGTYCMDLGATTMLFYTLRVREQILDIMEKTCGARMTFNYDCIGGVMQDLHPDFVKDVKALLEVLPANIKEYNKIFTGNVIARKRLEGVGVLSREDAIDRGVTGPSGRASGWACDMRKLRPYSIYTRLRRDSAHRRRLHGTLQGTHARNGTVCTHPGTARRQHPRRRIPRKSPEGTQTAGWQLVHYGRRLPRCIRHIPRKRRLHKTVPPEDCTPLPAVGRSGRPHNGRHKNRRPHHHRWLAGLYRT